MSESIPVRELRRGDVIADPHTAHGRLKITRADHRLGYLYVAVMDGERVTALTQRLILGPNEQLTLIERPAHASR